MDWGKMTMTLFGGLAIFLYGMELMTDALKAVAGDRMKTILEKLTTNRFAGVLTGAGVTAVVQSSSVTTVIVVGFVTAGLMNLSQSLGVIFGANIGTTITAQIVAFKVTKYALLMVTVGFGMMMISKKQNIKHWGAMLLGLGLVFFGMSVMSGAMKPLRSYQPFLDLMTQMENPLIGIMIAAAFTGLIQSSSATTGIVIVMATEGLVSLPAGIALAFGANVGTCVTAMLACIGKPRAAVQAAVAHLFFNVGGVLIWVAFIPYLAEFVTWLSPAANASLTGQERLAAEAPRQIANAHTVFNIVNTLLFIPFTVQIAALVQKLVPIKELTPEEAAVAEFKPKYLDENLVSTPPVALSMTRREILRMGEVTTNMLSGIPAVVFKGDTDKMEEMKRMDEQVDSLYGYIGRYLSKIGREDLSSDNADETMALATTNTEIENIGDIMEIHMSHLAETCQKSNIVFSEEELASLNQYHGMVLDAFKSALVGVEHDRIEAAKMALDIDKELIGGMNKLIGERQVEFLQKEHTPQEVAAFTLQSDIMENLKRIYEHTKRIARLVTREEGRTAMMLVD
ncbi:MAG: Na/Pi cotransporter family protein [Gammaproteobacteria bacterium]|nr:Na/Pi cotransporter family protein [Gammaproteobacteria bacterium]